MPDVTDVVGILDRFGWAAWAGALSLLLMVVVCKIVSPELRAWAKQRTWQELALQRAGHQAGNQTRSQHALASGMEALVAQVAGLREPLSRTTAGAAGRRDASPRQATPGTLPAGLSEIERALHDLQAHWTLMLEELSALEQERAAEVAAHRARQSRLSELRASAQRARLDRSGIEDLRGVLRGLQEHGRFVEQAGRRIDELEGSLRRDRRRLTALRRGHAALQRRAGPTDRQR